MSPPLATTTAPPLSTLSREEERLIVIETLEKVISKPLNSITWADPDKSTLVQGEKLKIAHCHNSWEIKFLVSGRFPMPYPGHEDFCLKAHDIHFIPPKVIHYDDNRKIRQDVLYFIVSFEKNLTSIAHINRKRSLTYFLQPTQTQSWHKFLGAPPQAMLELMQKGVMSTRENTKEYVQSMTRLFYSTLQLALKEGQHIEPQGQQRVIHNANEYISAHYHKSELTVDDIAGHVKVTPSYLLRLFQRHQNKTIRQALIDHRLKIAYQLLNEGHYSVKQVAFITGWNSPYYFSHCFTKAYHFPPSHLLKFAKPDVEAV